MASKELPAQGQPINVSTLPIPQLTSIKNQLTQELQHLTNSFAQLRAAQTKFRDCINSIRDGMEKKEQKEGTPILVPLTPSLYVPGKLASTETVLVDIGTGFYVEKSDENKQTPSEARKFYSSKVDELGQNLEAIVQGKQGNLNVVEDVLRQKKISESTSGSQDAGGGGGDG
ncbi:MAG: hypothetical protein L6R41_000139 [Letrouitia leprolyta]|nr:MAG: hypothetical protein L6R41_000139 [Letrouitia leprolyta]